MNITQDENCRFDYKFWDLKTIKAITAIQKRANYKSIAELNVIVTKRGNSPSSSDYVSQEEGFALVVKAGSNISKTGMLLTSGDYIEEAIYQSYKEKDQVLKEGDILLSSTGDGTLGKCSVYHNNKKPAIADGHVTVIRVDPETVYPEYVCDFLRKGFGSDQVNRLYTGSTGLIEITPEDVNKIIIPPLPTLTEQKKVSKELRKHELKTEEKISEIVEQLKQEEKRFYSLTQ